MEIEVSVDGEGPVRRERRGVSLTSKFRRVKLLSQPLYMSTAGNL